MFQNSDFSVVFSRFLRDGLTQKMLTHKFPRGFLAIFKGWTHLKHCKPANFTGLQTWQPVGVKSTHKLLQFMAITSSRDFSILDSLKNHDNINNCDNTTKSTIATRQQH
jgi:hypothetical protein